MEKRHFTELRTDRFSFLAYGEQIDWIRGKAKKYRGISRFLRHLVSEAMQREKAALAQGKE